ncbi:hypothetical protein F442_15465 [Phytophthora nicotianae P10297]|uniref:Uncharacterized protein n=1 Tax=Phytophthora nicotianae P10297 TaxID=1317064 RepID=W2YNM4_PHYNI|nr:hypothetical protein F442_15465 [Phytophthora nicotianae P10297]
MNHLWVLGDLDFTGRRFGAKGAHSLTGRMTRLDNDMIKRYDPKLEYVSKWISAFVVKDVKEMKQMIKHMEPMFDWRKRYTMYTTLFGNIE